MADEQNVGSNGQSRLDRLEGLMQLLIDDRLKFADQHNKLLTAQVLLTETVQKLAQSHKDLDDKLKELAIEAAESRRHVDDKLNALIAVVDGLVRHRPPQ